MEDCIVVELKAVATTVPLEERQLQSVHGMQPSGYDGAVPSIPRPKREVPIVLTASALLSFAPAYRAAALWFAGANSGLFAGESDERCSILIHMRFSFSAPDVSRGTDQRAEPLPRAKR